MDIRVENATRQHAEELAGTMRQVDRDEAWAMGRLSPMQALDECMLMSVEPIAFLVNGTVAGIVGVGTRDPLSDQGVPWLLCSDVEWTVPMLRASRRWVELVGERYASLSNYVDARNQVTLRWLRWLGFTVMPAAPYGPFKMPFHKFYLDRRQCA